MCKELVATLTHCMKKIFFCLALFSSLLAYKPIAAQEEFIEPASRTLTTFPFVQLTGGIVIIQARLGDSPDTLNFVLDTGSSGISLDSTTASEMHLHPIPTNKTIRAIAGIRTVPFLFNQKLHLHNLTVDSLDFHVNDYSILTAVYGERIDGIIGYSLINRYIIRINYDSMTLSICTKGTIRYPRGGYLLKPTIGTLAAQTVRVKDEKAVSGRFLYDMGAGVCFMFSKDFINDSFFLDKKRKLWIKEGEGVGGKIDMVGTVIKEVKLGPYRFRGVPVYIFDDVYNVTSYPYLGGLIGNDILRRFNIILNYEKKDIYIFPNSHFNDLFDYSYSGIELYMIGDRIILGDVAKDSPAEKCGLQEGDQVIAVNKDFTQNLNAYKVILQAPNEKVKFIIRRNNELKEFEFKIKSIR
jgi:hypothetical protein